MEGRRHLKTAQPGARIIEGKLDDQSHSLNNYTKFHLNFVKKFLILAEIVKPIFFIFFNFFNLQFHKSQS